MELMELVIADADGRDLRAVADYELDMAYGSDENDFELALPAGLAPPPEGLAYVDGTPWGGVVDSVEHSSGSRNVVCRGRTWSGVLAGKVLCPPAGQSHVVMDGPVQACLRSIISMTGLGGMFSAPDSEGEGSVSGYRMERFCDAWSGILAMLAASGLKPTLRRSGGVVLLGARPVVDWGSRVDSDLVGFTSRRVHRTVNHLVCAGAGEGEARAVVHLYADEAGNVSEVQTLFGADEVAALYDYTGADEAKLREDGAKRLREMQGEGSVEVEEAGGLDADVGDIVSARDWMTGQLVSATVRKRILRASGGAASVTCEVGSTAAASRSLSGSAESSGGGVSYAAGKGISITSGTISADVDADDLADVSGRAQRAAADALAAMRLAEGSVGGVSASAPLRAGRSGREISLSLDTVDAAMVNSWFA